MIRIDAAAAFDVSTRRTRRRRKLIRSGGRVLVWVFQIGHAHS
jgi:hypothetical protein